MSYIVGSLGNVEVNANGSACTALGQITFTLPDPSVIFGLFPHVNVGPVSRSDVAAAAAASGGKYTEEQLMAALAAQGKTVDQGFLASLPPWALPAGLAALVGGFLLLRRKKG